MEKKNKIILISIISVLIIIAIAVTIFFLTRQTSNSNIEESNSKVAQLYNTLSNEESYSFSAYIDDENNEYYAKQDDSVSYYYYIYEGEESKFLSKDGNQYLLVDEDKAYYTYDNNESNLNLIENILEEVMDTDLTTGKERVENKEYSYEEFSSYTELAMQDFTEDENVRTRLYFQNNNLVYIKTISDEKEELLKIEISNKIDENVVFEIPSDYQEN